jgi:hypothetical protein
MLRGAERRLLARSVYDDNTSDPFDDGQRGDMIARDGGVRSVALVGSTTPMLSPSTRAYMPRPSRTGSRSLPIVGSTGASSLNDVVYGGGGESAAQHGWLRRASAYLAMVGNERAGSPPDSDVDDDYGGDYSGDDDGDGEQNDADRSIAGYRLATMTDVATLSGMFVDVNEEEDAQEDDGGDAAAVADIAALNHYLATRDSTGDDDGDDGEYGYAKTAGSNHGSHRTQPFVPDDDSEACRIECRTILELEGDGVVARETHICRTVCADGGESDKEDEEDENDFEERQETGESRDKQYQRTGGLHGASRDAADAVSRCRHTPPEARLVATKRLARPSQP